MRATILEMSKQMSIVSSLTSFIAVEKRDKAEVYTVSGTLAIYCYIVRVHVVRLAVRKGLHTGYDQI